MSKDPRELMPAPPPRVAVYVARDAPRAVILRRGPSKWTHVILWHLDTDVFELGAWTKAHIYPECCDISPDGELFVYWIRKYGAGTYPGTNHWTAVSRPPWIKALALWECCGWGGGGHFTKRRKLNVYTSDRLKPEFKTRGYLRVRRFGWFTEVRHKEGYADSWRGHDHDGRSIWIEDGRVWRSDMPEDRMLLDLNELKPDPKPAPDWAGQWP